MALGCGGARRFRHRLFVARLPAQAALLDDQGRPQLRPGRGHRQQSESLAIIRAVVAMADSLEMSTTAEGVETEAELE
jgi:hypothetical protein